MSNQKITGLTADTSPASGDLIPTVDISDTTMAATGTNKQVTLGDAITKASGLASGIVKSTSGALSAVTAPAGVIVGTTDTQALTNKDLTTSNTFPTFNQDTTGKSAKTDALNSASTVVNVSAATAPSTGQVLTATDSTHATWQSPAGGGGQTLVTKIVAPSGGDYTTLSAALAAASNGWSIAVQPGSYTEGGATITLTDISVFATNPSATSLNFGANDLNMGGSNTTLQGCHLIFNGGKLVMNGTYAQVLTNIIETQSTGRATSLQSDSGLVQGNRFFYNSTSNPSDVNFWFGSGVSYTRVIGNRFEHLMCQSTNPVRFDAVSGVFSDNVLNLYTGNGGDAALYVGGTDATIQGNTINCNGFSSWGINVQASHLSIIGNTIKGAGTLGILALGQNITVASNFIRTSAGSLIRLTTGQSTATGNVLEMNSAGSIGVEIYSGNYHSVTGNSVVGSGSTGISVASGSTKCVVVGNACTNSTSSPISDSGTSTVLASNGV